MCLYVKLAQSAGTAEYSDCFSAYKINHSDDVAPVMLEL